MAEVFRMSCSGPLELPYVLISHFEWQVGVQACHGSLERSADWLFSHTDDLDAAVASVNGASAPQAAAPSTGIACQLCLKCVKPLQHLATQCLSVSPPREVRQICIERLACVMLLHPGHMLCMR